MIQLNIQLNIWPVDSITDEMENASIQIHPIFLLLLSALVESPVSSHTLRLRFRSPGFICFTRFGQRAFYRGKELWEYPVFVWSINQTEARWSLRAGAGWSSQPTWRWDKLSATSELFSGTLGEISEKVVGEAHSKTWGWDKLSATSGVFCMGTPGIIPCTFGESLRNTNVQMQWSISKIIILLFLLIILLYIFWAFLCFS